MTLKELAEKLNIPFQGDENFHIGQIKDTERLKKAEDIQPGSVYFVGAKKIEKKHPYLMNNPDIAVLCTASLKDAYPNAVYEEDKTTRIKFISMLGIFAPEIPPPNPQEKGLIHPTVEFGRNTAIYPGVSIMANAVIGDNVTLYPGVVIESHAKIGEGCILYPNVVVGHHCRIGKNCILYAGCIIGADGFGYHDQDGIRYRIPQIGNVVLEDYVDIGAGSTVDRATIESTIIRENTKLDDQVHIGHNAIIGKNCYFAGNAGVAGSAVVEDNVLVGGMCAISDHVTVGEKSMLMGLTGAANDLAPNQMYFGIPAKPARHMHRVHALMDKLPEMYEQIKKLTDEDAGH